MAAVRAQVESHLRSKVVEKLRGAVRTLSKGDVTEKLAKPWVLLRVERAIEPGVRAAKVFTDRRLFILGEIITTRR